MATRRRATPARSSRRRLTIADRMSPAPFTVGADLPLAVAHEVMRAHRIRHLPVLREGALVGVVSERDLQLVESLAGVDPRTVAVEEAMTVDPFAVGPTAALGDVVARMSRSRIGSAIVVKRGKVVGVFTTVDALDVLAELLATE